MAMNMNTTGTQDTNSKYTAAKAWAYYHTTGTAGQAESHGFSGLTDRGTGYASLEFTTTQPNINWSLSGDGGDHCRLNIDGSAHLTTAVHMISHTGGTNTAVDCHRNFITVHGT